LEIGVSYTDLSNLLSLSENDLLPPPLD